MTGWFGQREPFSFDAQRLAMLALAATTAVPGITGAALRHTPIERGKSSVVSALELGVVGLTPARISQQDKWVQVIGKAYPQLAIHSIGPSEILHMAKVSGVSIEEAVLRIKAAGLDTIPGGGGEIFAPRVRKRIVVLAVTLDLATLGVFKYYGFFATEINGLLDLAGLGLPLPLAALWTMLPAGWPAWIPAFARMTVLSSLKVAPFGGLLLLTNAPVRVLREHNVKFTHHLYEYEEKGGTAVSSRELGFPENQIVKTLIMEVDAKKPMIVLMTRTAEMAIDSMRSPSANEIPIAAINR